MIRFWVTGTVSKMGKQVRELGHVSCLPLLFRLRKYYTKCTVGKRKKHSTYARQIAQNSNISHTIITKLLKLHPYKIHQTQELCENDPGRKFEFCKVMMTKKDKHDLLLILFSEFYRQWCRANPYWMRELHT